MNRVKVAKALYFASALVASFTISMVVLRYLENRQGAEPVSPAAARIDPGARPEIPAPPQARKVPILPGAMAKGGGMYETGLSVLETESFYRERLAKTGWKPLPEQEAILAKNTPGRVVAVARGGYTCVMYLEELEARGGTAVVATLTRKSASAPAKNSEEK